MTTLYAIQKSKGVYVSRGGRTTKSFAHAWLWADKNIPKGFMDLPLADLATKVHVALGEDVSMWKVITLNVKIKGMPAACMRF